VINNVHIQGAEREPQAQPFLQPTIGETIYFLDGVAGVVKYVIINPDNRRVVAMVLRRQAANPLQELKSTDIAQAPQARSPERLIVVPIDLVRYLTKASGFLHISSNESKQYMDFDRIHFSPPTKGWKAPYPYCPDDVLFPLENRRVEYQILGQLPRSPFVVAWVEAPLREELLASDSLRE
jgi:hypothetical protein